MIPLNYVKWLITGDSATIMYYVSVYVQFTLLISIIDTIAKSKYKYIPFLVLPI